MMQRDFRRRKLDKLFAFNAVIIGLVEFAVVLSLIGWAIMTTTNKPIQLPVVITSHLVVPSVENTVKKIIPYRPTRIQLPDEVRGIYWHAGTAGSRRAQELIEYIRTNGLNTVVIDLKMDNGAVAFIPKNDALKIYAQTKASIKDLEKLLDTLASEQIYRIARVAVFRDKVFAQENPELALKTASGNLWHDTIGSVWIDPSAQEAADYAVELGREAHQRGFDEIQYDYVRFPSDGTISSIVYPIFDLSTSTKVEVIRKFFKKVGGALKQEGIPVSFDVFGMTFWSSNDYNIGQRLVDVYSYADFVSPMVYPSHYPDGFRGFGNPALYPYEIVYQSLEEGKKLLEQELGMLPEESKKKIRPWLQDFDIGAVYRSNLIEAQIQAVRDAGASGWMLWNARNVYEPANYIKKLITDR